MTRPIRWGPFTENMMADALSMAYGYTKEETDEMDDRDRMIREARFVLRLLHEMNNGFIRDYPGGDPEYWSQWLIDHAKLG